MYVFSLSAWLGGGGGGVYISSASRKKVLSALRRAKRSFEIIKVKGFFLISPQWSVKIETVIVFR